MGPTGRVPRPAEGRRWRAFLAASLLVAAAQALAFGPTLGHGFIDFDDDLYVTSNRIVLAGLGWEGTLWAFSTFHGGNWHPLTWLSHMLDVSIFGRAAWGHHLSSLLLHLATSLLLLFLLHRLTGRLGPGLLATLCFSVHPLRVESVAWIAERKDVLSGALWIAAVWVYCRLGRPSGRGGPFALVLLLAALAMMAKPMAVALPLTLLICDLALSSRPGRLSGAPAIHRVLEKAPLFAMASVVGALTVMAQRDVGALKSLEQVPLATRAANAPLALVRYLGKTLWPSGLAVHYPYDVSPAPWEALRATGLLVVVTGLCLAGRRRYPLLLAGWLWYLVTLLPVIGLLQVGSQAHADRYTYVPSVGLSIMVAALVTPTQQRRKPGLSSLLRKRAHSMSGADGTLHLSTAGEGPSRLPGIARALIASAAVVTLCLASRSQARTWRDTTTLFRHAVSVCPDDALSQYSLARALEIDGKREEAVRHYEGALRLRPGFREAHYRIGLALLDEGDLAGAVSHLEAEIRRERYHGAALRALGLARWRRGETEEALEQFESAVRVDPLDSGSWCGAARARASLGDTRGAMGAYERALGLDPADHECRYDYAVALAASGRSDEAQAECERVLRSAPGHEGHEGARRLLEELRLRSSSAPVPTVIRP